MHSALGFSTYRMTHRNPTHRLALQQGIQRGVAMIDTAASFMNGEALRAVTDVLSAGPIPRHLECLLKIGVIQGDALAQTEGQFADHPINDHTRYSLDTAYFEYELSRAQDLFPALRPWLLIQSPEVLVQKYAGNWTQLYPHLESLLDWLEKQTLLGRIAGYGISSQTLADPMDAPDAISLEAIVDLAQRAGPATGFRVVSFPFNLIETAALIEPLFAQRSLLESAAAQGLLTVIQRPLYARQGNGQTVRLSDIPSRPESDIFNELKISLDLALKMERSQNHPKLLWAHRIRENLESLMDLDRWRNVRAFQIEPGLAKADQEQVPMDPQYFATLNRVLEAMEDYAALSVPHEMSHLTQTLDRIAPELRAEPLLQRKLIAIYQATPGIDRILVGMRRPSYVEQLTAPLQCELKPEQLQRIYREAFVRDP